MDDVLALARADAGELRLEVLPVAVGGVIEEVYEALSPLARRERQVTLVREIPPDLPLVLADRQRLAQVLLNLVRNAITYTPAGGIVSLSVERPDPDHLVLIVADTGIGIPPEDLARVFERFYRTDASRARASGGFGLGLAIVRDLVRPWAGRSARRARSAKAAASACRCGSHGTPKCNRRRTRRVQTERRGRRRERESERGYAKDTGGRGRSGPVQSDSVAPGG